MGFGQPVERSAGFGQRASREREPGNEGNVVLGAIVDHVVSSAVAEVVLVLDAYHPHDLLRALNLRDGNLGEPNVADLSFCLELRQSFDSLFDREKLGSTGLGYGVAIPHGRIKLLKEPVCAFVRTASPIAFESPDAQPVNLVFAMLVPEHATEAHLELLSELAQMFSDASLREALARAADAALAHRVIVEWSPYAPAQRTAAL